MTSLNLQNVRLRLRILYRSQINARKDKLKGPVLLSWWRFSEELSLINLLDLTVQNQKWFC